jgi:hypothetical protein
MVGLEEKRGCRVVLYCIVLLGNELSYVRCVMYDVLSADVLGMGDVLCFVFLCIPYPNIVKIITYRITAKEVGRCQIQIQKIPNIFFTYNTGIIRLSFLEKERTLLPPLISYFSSLSIRSALDHDVIPQH